MREEQWMGHYGCSLGLCRMVTDVSVVLYQANTVGQSGKFWVSHWALVKQVLSHPLAVWPWTKEGPL